MHAPVKNFRILAALTALPLLAVPAVQAGEGHDHGPAAAPAGPALPRFAAVSEVFEMVGVLEGRRLVLYVDRSADNAPVLGAQIELEMAGTKLAVEQHDDTYDVMLAAEPTPGVMPITATIKAGSDVDLLAGELEIAAPAVTDEAAHGLSGKAVGSLAAGVVATLLVLGAAARRIVVTRRAKTGAAA